MYISILLESGLDKTGKLVMSLKNSQLYSHPYIHQSRRVPGDKIPITFSIGKLAKVPQTQHTKRKSKVLLLLIVVQPTTMEQPLLSKPIFLLDAEEVHAPECGIGRTLQSSLCPCAHPPASLAPQVGKCTAHEIKSRNNIKWIH